MKNRPFGDNPPAWWSRKYRFFPKGSAAVRCIECKAEVSADGYGSPMVLRHEPTCSGLRERQQ